MKAVHSNNFEFTIDDKPLVSFRGKYYYKIY